MNSQNVEQNLLAQLHDIYSFMYVPLWQRTWFQVTIVCLAIVTVVCMSALVYYWYSRKKRPAWEIALRKITHLQADPDQAQFFYHELIDSIKKFIQTKDHIIFSEKTDYELLAYLQPIVPDDLQAPLATLINNATLIKFAEQNATRDSMIQDRASGIEIVQSLRPLDQN